MDPDSAQGGGFDSPPAGAGDVAAAAIRGDREAIRRVWEANRRWIAAVILAHKPRRAEVEDLLQEVAGALVRKIGSLRDPSALKPWLRTVAINAALAAARDRSGRALRLSGEPDIDGRPAAFGRPGSDVADQREEAGRILDLASRLPEGYREPLLLRCVKGMSYRQIGRLMGLPESTIETRIARGRRMLRELALGAELPASKVGEVPAER